MLILAQDCNWIGLFDTDEIAIAIKCISTE